MEDIDFETLQLIVRENIEFDEKVPQIAKKVIEQGINYGSEEDIVTEALLNILSEELESFEDMTQEEMLYSLHILEVACALSEMQSAGVVKEENGYYSVVNKNHNI